MARHRPVRLGIALGIVLVLNLVHANEKCKSGCNSAAQQFKYVEGITYKYNYDGKIAISLSSAESQETQTEVKATVLLTQLPECNQLLRLENVQVIGQDGKKHGKIPDIEKPIRINFHDGHVSDSICAEPGDTQNSLNIKRAIASLFQVNRQKSHETDVFGLCPVEIVTSWQGEVETVQKTKHLNKCAYRETIKQDYISTSFDLNSEIKSSPILSGDYLSHQKIKKGILEEAKISENYLFVPFSVGRNGAKSVVESKIVLAGTVKDNPANKVSHPRSIIFENPHPVNVEKTNVATILKAIKETAKTIHLTVNENTAKEYINLIKILKVSNKDDILTVYGQVKAGAGFADKLAAKKLFLDAILTPGNGNTIEVALELLKSKELSPIEEKRVYLGLSFARHVTEKAVISAAELINRPNLPREAYLGVGTLAGRHCQDHDCEHVEAVNKLIAKLIGKLGDLKAANRNEENEMIYVLKALTNIHHLTDAVLNKLATIAEDQIQPNRLRVAALESFLADPCKEKLRDSALKVLKNIQQDSEVRIKAYLVLAQCPNAKIGNEIKALLDSEPSYQVGGFIVSHIKNLRASANPDKEAIKQHLGFINLPTRFPVDFRKFSYNGEVSYTVDTLGVANSLESNVIYSQDSWLPRSSSWNLTGQVFGHNINFLELATRQENLDRLVEHYLGPEGVLRKSTVQGAFTKTTKPIVDIYHHLKEKLQNTLRSRRDVSKAEIDAIEQEVHVKTNSLNKDLDLDLSVKLFGSELLFLNVFDNAKKYTPNSIIDKIVGELNHGLDNLKKFEETLRSNLLFLDAELSYPTSLGFPLRLTVEGVSNTQLKASGSIDVRALLAGNKNTAVKIGLVPSGTLQVGGRLTLDAHVAEIGLKVISTLHSSTGGDLSVEIFNNGQGFDVKVALPVEKQTLVAAHHEIVFETREHGQSEVSVPLKFAQNKQFMVCLDQLTDMIGLEFCADFYGPNLSGKQVPILPFPFAGDAKGSIVIERGDLSHYHLREIIHTGEKIGGEFVVEAIGKSNNKKLSLGVEIFGKPDKFIKATVVSPIKSFTVEGRVILEDHEKSLLLKAVLDNQEYYGKVGVKVDGNSDKITYQPVLEYKTPAENAAQNIPYHVEGKVIVERHGNDVKYILDHLKLVIPGQKNILIDGNFGTEAPAFFADVTVSDGQLRGSFKGRLQTLPGTVKFDAEVKNSLNPNTNFDLKGEFKKQEHQRDVNLQLTHGKDLSSKTNVLTISHSLNCKGKTAKELHFSTKNRLTYPLQGLDAKFDFAIVPKSIDYDLDLKLSKKVQFGSLLKLKYAIKATRDYQLEFDVRDPHNKIQLKSSLQAVGADESKVSHVLEVNGKKAEAHGKIKHHFKPHDIIFAGDMTYKLPTHNTPFKTNWGAIIKTNNIDLHYKVLSGTTPVVDAVLKGTKGGNANGHVKVTIKDVLEINGQIKAVKGNGNSDLLIDVKSIGKSVKAESTFLIHDPNFNVDFTLYPNFNEDKTQKIFVSTKNKITHQNVDSKNIVDLAGQKFEANVKASLHGDVHTGKQVFDADVTLPNEHFFEAKFNRDVKTVNNVINGQGLISLEHRKNKKTAGRKLTLKGIVKNTNLHEAIYDINYKLHVDDGLGHTGNSDLSVKRQKQGEKYVVAVQNKITSNLLKHPIQTALGAEYKDRVGKYHAKTNYGTDSSLNVEGNYDWQGHGKPIVNDVNVELKTPLKALKEIKLTNKVSAKARESPTDFNILKVLTHLFVTGETKKQGPIIDFNGELDVKVSEKLGDIKISNQYGRDGSILATGSYDLTHENGGKIKSDLAVNFGKDKKIKAGLAINRIAPHEYKMDVEFDLPTETYKTNHLTVHSKRSKDGKEFSSEVDFVTDGKKWRSESQLQFSDITPTIHVKVTNPEGKVSEITAKAKKISEKNFSGELKLIRESSNFLLEGSVDANAENLDDFFVKLYGHCPALKVEKVHVELHNKPSNGGRTVQVDAKSGSTNLLSGSASYTTREERGKFIAEGSGSFKVKNQEQSANFKYIFQSLSADKNDENGIEISLDAGLGHKAIDAELKITNKQFRYLNSYCEEKKQCAYIEIDAKTIQDDLSTFKQVVEIAIDLRKLGLSHEFGLKAVTDRKGYVLDHTVDIHFQREQDVKYQYSVYLHPKEAGLSLSTPKRTIALEGTVDIPRDIQKIGKISGQIAFYLDKKNHANEKSLLVGFVDISEDQKVHSELKFTNPGLEQPLVVSYQVTRTGNQKSSRAAEETLVLDIFNNHNKKITITRKVSGKATPEGGIRAVEGQRTVNVKSPGLNIDISATESVSISSEPWQAIYDYEVKYHVGSSKYDSSLKLSATPKEAQFLIRVLNLELWNIKSKIITDKSSLVVNTDLQAYGCKPATSHLEVKNYNTFKYWISRNEKPNDKLTLSSAVIPGQIVDLRADVVAQGKKQDLFHVSLKLDDADFLKPDYSVDTKAIDKLGENFRGAIEDHLKVLRTVSEKYTKEVSGEVGNLGELAKNSIPNLKPVREYYVSELRKLKEELLADKSMRDFGEFLKTVFSSLAHALSESVSSFSDLVEKIAYAIHESFASTFEIIEKEIIPSLKELAEKSWTGAVEAFGELSEIVLGLVAKVGQILEHYQPQFKTISAALGELFQEFGRLLTKSYLEAKKIVLDQVDRVLEEIKASPILEEINNKYHEALKEFEKFQPQIPELIKNLLETVKELLPVPELQKIIDAIKDYLEKKTRGDKVDDIEEWRKIAAVAAHSIKELTSGVVGERIPQNWQQRLTLPLSFDFLSKLPRLAAVKLSPVTYLLHENLSGIPEFLLSYVDSPLKWFPPFPLDGVVIQGQHIFTFDGKHLTFPGKCSYLLSGDAVNSNFSVVGTYGNGLLEAITLADKSGVFTYKKDGQLLVNNAVHEFPAYKGQISARRDLDTIELKTKAGVRVFCEQNLVACGIEISGFYHGQVKGLLGNGNHEPYDDLTVPSGKIVGSEAEFGNAYKVGACAATVSVPDHKTHTANEECNKLFDWESPLALCYPFVPRENFKHACEHGLAAGVKDTKHALSIGYTYLCNRHGIPKHLPEEFGTCTNGLKPHKIGESFTVQTPGKEADIVLVIETATANKPVYDELIQPLVQQLTTDLAAQGVKDVKFHLIAYGGEHQEPVHVTVGGKLDFTGKAPALNFKENPAQQTLSTGHKNLDQLIRSIRATLHDLHLALGLYLEAETYNVALKYPFRAEALKTLVVVTSEPCEIGRFFPLQVLRSLFFTHREINLNWITPVKEFKMQNAKHTKDVVGFNQDSVFLVGDAKKKNPELRKDLYYNDYCIWFTLHQRGNIFNSDNFIANKDTRKQFAQVVSYNIAHQMTSQEQTLDCECRFVDTFSAQNVCRVENSKEK